jgi:hypothetical protein
MATAWILGGDADERSKQAHVGEGFDLLATARNQPTTPLLVIQVLLSLDI